MILLFIDWSSCFCVTEAFLVSFTATDKLTSPEEVRLAQIINQRVAIWQGDIALLEVDAVVNSTASLLLESRGGG